MSYKNAQLKTDRDGRPVSQYFNPEINDFEVSKGRNGAVAFHEQGTIIRDIWSGNSNITKTQSKKT